MCLFVDANAHSVIHTFRFNRSEIDEIKIALSSRIEHLDAFLGDAETYPECVFQARMAEQKKECEHVLARLRGATE